ncbi:BTAD domain-containing putative transcriptional regulator [Catelliglobosispora koreensis]|uniref:BTAD domain-containing putative transcriptional regulator n=1 Tax=Catelliglobosispora koreensis TaxID=129052 RepID=UPI00035C8267|nr:BTAD domain-containing putative transcriptional regulator [Catelliglobosispora koreensis]
MVPALPPDLADQVQELTADWPELAEIASGLLTAHETPLPLLAWLTAADSPVTAYVDQHVLACLSPSARRLLDDVAGLSPISPGLAEALGHEGALVQELITAGVLRRGAVVPVIARLCQDRCQASPPLSLAASWYQQRGLTAPALRTFALAGDLVQCGQLLDTHGAKLLSQGHAALVAETLARLAPGDRTRARQLLLGDALRTLGAPLKAAQAYAVVADAEPVWDMALAWRMGQIHYHRGDSLAALEAFGRAPDNVAATADSAMLLAWKASAQLQLGRVAEATRSATIACGHAVTSGEPAAEATAYISLALCHSVAGNAADADELLGQAFAIAEESGDIVIRSRVLTTQTFRLIGQARFPEALESARRTRQCATAAGHSNMRLVAVHNEADILMMLGRFDDAIREYQRAQAFSARMGSRRNAAAQAGLAEVYRQRGWTQQARSAFEAAIALAEQTGQRDIHIGALAGLARAHLAEDLTAAATVAEQAVELASGRLLVQALVAKGWVALRAGDPAAAAAIAEESTTIARDEGYAVGLAECLELRAASETEVKRARSALREALAIWTAAGCAVHAARVQSSMGALAYASADERFASLMAAEVLATAGIPGHDKDASTVEIRAFGRFEVWLSGEVVPPAQWQSRKARDLLRILVARRGRPVPRGELSELLWPDDDPSRTGHRLSVLLSIIRGVLDPSRAYPADHFLAADQSCLRLQIAHLHIDVENFLGDTAHGRRLWDKGLPGEATRLLSVAVQAYRADVFDDDPYAEWASALREEARAAYLSALRLLAWGERKQGNVAATVGHLLRLLAMDPYDEAAHLDLIDALAASGQHGEAKRAQGRYEQAMRAIGVQPSLA